MRDKKQKVKFLGITEEQFATFSISPNQNNKGQQPTLITGGYFGDEEITIEAEFGDIELTVKVPDINKLEDQREELEKFLFGDQTQSTNYFLKPLSLNFKKAINLYSFLLHKDYRENFLGDIKESRHAMLNEGQSKGWVNLNTFF